MLEGATVVALEIAARSVNMSDRAFGRFVAVIVVLRLAPAVVVGAANGRGVPGLPEYAYGAPRGDTYGFYAAAREFMTTWARAPIGSFAASLVLLAGGAAGAWILWRRGRREGAVLVGTLSAAVFLAVWVHEMRATGAGAIGWPIVWALPLFPLRVVGLLGYREAYYLGIAVLLVCNAVTVVATALIARRLVPGRMALLAPSLLAIWPFMMLHLGGSGTVLYGSWLDDQGLLLYSEPLSTALVAAGLALLVLRRSDTICATFAGALLGYSAVVRLSNVTIVIICFVALLFARAAPSVIGFALASAGVAAIAAAFWPHGYVSLNHSSLSQTAHDVFSWSHVLPSWRDSTVFDPWMLAILLPLAILGLYALRRQPFEAWVLGAVVAATAVFYSPYSFTALHPRFLFVALPSLFVLEAAGAASLTVVVQNALFSDLSREGRRRN
jgi:hypothetical protein